jgi:ADP-heptose:LPS heptosyltransferase
MFNIRGWMRLCLTLNAGEYDRVYDLQNNDRTALYLKLFSRKNQPEWVGAARGASHRNHSKARTAGHAFDGHVQTLALAGIKNFHIDTLEWMQGDLSPFDLKAPYVLIVPGSAPNRPEKRWPAAHYAQLCKFLIALGLQPVILGTANESELAVHILKENPLALNLTQRTDFHQIAALARNAAGAIGNDTGPMHLIAATGCPSLVLFSGASNPLRHAPKGAHVETLQKQVLAELSPEAVLERLSGYFLQHAQTLTRH